MKSNFEWKLWGKNDPLFGVASWPGRERGGENPWTDEEFYALGDDWLDFDSAWRRAVGYAPGVVLEIGSGAGRITRRLAEVFEHVIAVDVSPDIIEYARTRVVASNISWQLSDGGIIPAADSTVDAIFSCHVFQHFPANSAQLSVFKEARRVLKTGGTFFVHLPMHLFPEVNGSFSRCARAAYAAFLHLSSAKAHLCRALMRFGGKPYMHGVSYEMPALLSDLAGLGFSDLGISAISVRTAPGIHYCVSGRR